MAKAWASQGSSKTGPSGGRSGGIKIGLPQIGRHGIARMAGLAPDVAGGKPHRVEGLRVFALAMRIGVGENMSAVQAHDLTFMATQIARQPRMCHGMHVLRPDLVSHRITRRGRRARGRSAFGESR